MGTTAAAARRKVKVKKKHRCNGITEWLEIAKTNGKNNTALNQNGLLDLLGHIKESWYMMKDDRLEQQVTEVGDTLEPQEENGVHNRGASESRTDEWASNDKHCDCQDSPANEYKDDASQGHRSALLSKHRSVLLSKHRSSLLSKHDSPVNEYDANQGLGSASLSEHNKGDCTIQHGQNVTVGHEGIIVNDNMPVVQHCDDDTKQWRCDDTDVEKSCRWTASINSGVSDATMILGFDYIKDGTNVSAADGWQPIAVGTPSQVSKWFGVTEQQSTRTLTEGDIASTRQVKTVESDNGNAGTMGTMGIDSRGSTSKKGLGLGLITYQLLS